MVGQKGLWTYSCGGAPVGVPCTKKTQARVGDSSCLLTGAASRLLGEFTISVSECWTDS